MLQDVRDMDGVAGGEVAGVPLAAPGRVRRAAVRHGGVQRAGAALPARARRLRARLRLRLRAPR